LDKRVNSLIKGKQGKTGAQRCNFPKVAGNALSDPANVSD